MKPGFTETFVLGASGLSRDLSPWRVYHMATGRIPMETSADAPLDQCLREALIMHLENSYGAFVDHDTDNLSFAPRLDLPPVRRLKEPGTLDIPPESPIIVEMPDRDGYEHQWHDLTESRVPFGIRARANMRMTATGASQCLVWVVADMGRIDCFHVVPFDERLSDRLRHRANLLMSQIDQGKSPDPEDDDIGTAIEISESNRQDEQHIAADDGALLDLAAYEAASDERRSFEAFAKQPEKVEREMKARLLRRLLSTQSLVLPDGRRVTSKVIRTRETSKKASSWTRLDILKASK